MRPPHTIANQVHYPARDLAGEEDGVGMVAGHRRDEVFQDRVVVTRDQAEVPRHRIRGGADG